MNVQAGQASYDPCRETAGDASDRSLLPVSPPAADNVSRLDQPLDQGGDVGWVILKIAIEGDDDMALNDAEARCQRRRLPEAVTVPEDAQGKVRQRVLG